MRHHRRLLRRLRLLYLSRGVAVRVRVRLTGEGWVCTATPLARPDRVSYAEDSRRIGAIREMLFIVTTDPSLAGPTVPESRTITG